MPNPPGNSKFRVIQIIYMFWVFADTGIGVCVHVSVNEYRDKKVSDYRIKILKITLIQILF